MITMQQHTLRTWLIHTIIFMAAAQSLSAQDTVLVACDSTNVVGTYCYVDNDDHTWLWQSECGNPIILQFTSGTIESNPNDQLKIYDGMDNLSPIVWLNTSSSPTVDLTGLQFVGTSGYLYMEMTSNASNCCATDGLLAADTDWEWAWTCSASSGTVGVEVASLGDFSIYPNPATHLLSIRLPNNTNGPVEIRILNAMESVVLADLFTCTGGEAKRMDLRNLPTGSYCVVLTDPAGSMTQRLEVLR